MNTLEKVVHWRRGLIAGAICFVVTAGPLLAWTLLVFISEPEHILMFLDMESLIFYIALFIQIALAALFGFSVARKWWALMIISAILALIPTILTLYLVLMPLTAN